MSPEDPAESPLDHSASQPARPNRRERIRQETTREIKATALAYMVTHGVRELSLRGIARDIGLTPSALYRYFENREALLAVLAADARESLLSRIVEALTQVPQDAHSDRWRAVCAAYRSWALAHPGEFTLLFASTAGAGRERVPRDMGSLLHLVSVSSREYARAIAAGSAEPRTSRVREAFRPEPRVRDQPPHILDEGTLGVLLSAWAALHGYVTLEVFGHLAGLVDQPDDLYALHVSAVMHAMGYTTDALARS